MPKDSMLSGKGGDSMTAMNEVNIQAKGTSTEKFSEFQPKGGNGGGAGEPSIMSPSLQTTSSGIMPGVSNKKGNY